MSTRTAGHFFLLGVWVAATTWGSLGLPVDQKETDRPNIVFILADDFGWGDVSCNNPDGILETPNIDRLARGGVRFTNAFTPHSVCSPTRYALLTGGRGCARGCSSGMGNR
jgi:hypothetical protein